MGLNWITMVRKVNKKLVKKAKWSHAWKQSAHVFRDLFLDVSEEWEAERDRYQAMLKERDEIKKILDVHKRSLLCSNKEWWKCLNQLDEARRWAIHFKGLYEQGAPMTIAGMNTRIAELEKKADILTGRLNLNKLAIAARNTRIRELEAVLRHAAHDPALCMVAGFVRKYL